MPGVRPLPLVPAGSDRLDPLNLFDRVSERAERQAVSCDTPRINLCHGDNHLLERLTSTGMTTKQRNKWDAKAIGAALVFVALGWAALSVFIGLLS